MLKAVQLNLGLTPNANGTVTQINTGLGLTGGPITTTGTISLIATGVAAGVYGSANQVPQITLNAQGQATLAANVTITPAAIGAVPNTVHVLAGTGLAVTPATGPLTANVTVSDAASGVVAATYGNAADVAQLIINAQGRVTLAANVPIAIDVSQVANAVPSYAIINPGTGMTGGGAVIDSPVLSIADTTVLPGTYGNASQISTFVVNQQGQLTYAGQVPIGALDNATISNATISGSTVSNSALANVTLTSMVGMGTSSSANGTTNMMVGAIGYLTLTINGAAAKIPYYAP